MSDQAVEIIRRAAHWFEAVPDGFGPLLDSIGDASVVLLGEASHSTHEFYRSRTELTKILIQRNGFHIVAVEADWPDAYRANRWVRNATDEPGAMPRNIIERCSVDAWNPGIFATPT
jgi:erythromycin esterase-like protein